MCSEIMINSYYISGTRRVANVTNTMGVIFGNQVMNE
jgi:hypothetical protein